MTITTNGAMESQRLRTISMQIRSFSRAIALVYVVLLLISFNTSTAFISPTSACRISTSKGGAKFDAVCRHASHDPESSSDEKSSPVVERFLNPKIDDRGLPIADALVAQIVAPSFQVFWLGLSRSPLPTWLHASLWAPRGSLVAPTLIHGAGLACCWVAGALAARAFESKAFDVSGGKGYGTVFLRTMQAGAFAVGLLILSTQIDLLAEFGRYVQLGESEETDRRLLVATSELINDVFFEAVTLTSWRLYRASFTANASNDQ